MNSDLVKWERLLTYEYCKNGFIIWDTDMLCKGNEENEKAVRKRRISPLLNKCKTWNQELWEYARFWKP